MLNCPKCNHDHAVKNGKDGPTGFQKYMCKNCKHQFVPSKPITEHHYRETNAEKLEYHRRTYKELFLKLRYDTHEDLLERIEAYAHAHPARGDVQKKAIAVLEEHFPRV